MSESIRVLHVDDDPDVADLTATFLERHDGRIDVETAHSADEGLERLAESPVDCVVSDYDMPGRNGIEFLEAVREDDPEVPFILFTGKGSEEVASDAISAGVTDYLQKESGTEDYELLANRIVNVVTQHRAERLAAKQERILTLLRDVNHSLVQSTTRDEIETSVTERFAEADPYRLAWMGDYDDERTRIEPRTVAGVDADVVPPISLADRPDGETTIRETLRRGDLTVTTPSDSTPVVWDDHPPVSYREAAIVPITYHGTEFGVLVLYAAAPEHFDGAERAMLDEIAGDTAQAIFAAETRQTLERHRTAVETVPEGVFVLDADANVELANERAADLVGRSIDDALGESFLTFVMEGLFDDDVVNWYLDSVREMLSSSSDREEAWYQTELRPPEGEPRLVEIHLTLRPIDEEFRGTVGIVRDVTERRERERELEQSRERYRNLVENAPVPIALCDGDGELVYVNDAAVSFARAADQATLLGESVLEFVHPSERDEASTNLRAVLESDESLSSIERSLVDREGNRKEVILTAVPVTYQDEAAAQIVLKDITEQKDRERSLEWQNERLDEFAGIVSHDLRGPLNVAQGRLELAFEAPTAEHPEHSEQREHLERLGDALDRMETLIEDILALARDGETVDESRPIALEEACEGCCGNLDMGDASLVFETQTTVRADRSRLQQLLRNLVQNAVEHGGDDVTVTIGDLDEGSGFYLEDDGVGIPDEHRDHVFDMGYSTDDAGTGLGLSIVERVAEAHGWDVHLTEGHEGGARFEIHTESGEASLESTGRVAR